MDLVWRVGVMTDCFSFMMLALFLLLHPLRLPLLPFVPCFVFPLIISPFALFVSLTMVDCCSPPVRTVSCMDSKRARDSQHTRSPHTPLGSVLCLLLHRTPLTSPQPERTRRWRCGSWGRRCRMNVWLPSKAMMMQCGQSRILLTVLISWVEVMIVHCCCGSAPSKLKQHNHRRLRWDLSFISSSSSCPYLSSLAVDIGVFLFVADFISFLSPFLHSRHSWSYERNAIIFDRTQTLSNKIKSLCESTLCHIIPKYREKRTKCELWSVCTYWSGR